MIRTQSNNEQPKSSKTRTILSCSNSNSNSSSGRSRSSKRRKRRIIYTLSNTSTSNPYRIIVQPFPRIPIRLLPPPLEEDEYKLVEEEAERWENEQIEEKHKKLRQKCKRLLEEEREEQQQRKQQKKRQNQIQDDDDDDDTAMTEPMQSSSFEFGYVDNTNILLEETSCTRQNYPKQHFNDEPNEMDDNQINKDGEYDNNNNSMLILNQIHRKWKQHWKKYKDKYSMKMKRRIETIIMNSRTEYQTNNDKEMIKSDNNTRGILRMIQRRNVTKMKKVPTQWSDPLL